MNKPFFAALTFFSMTLLLGGDGALHADDVTLTSYYPTPYGQYSTLSSTGTTLLATGSGAQIGIGTTTLPASQVLLDLTSTTRGLLLPRMNTTDRDAIPSPQSGLLIYNSSLTAAQIRVNSDWVTIAGGAGGGSFYWGASGDNIYNTNNGNAGYVGIGTTTPSAALHASGGAFLAKGDTGTTPPVRDEYRFVWIPSHAALRVGTTNSRSEWNDSYIAPGSIAIGEGARQTWGGATNQDAITLFNATSTGMSITIGNAAATHNPAVAIGSFAEASGPSSYAIGYGAQTMNPGGNFVIGGDHVVNSVPNSVIIAGGGAGPSLFIGSCQDASCSQTSIGSVGVGTNNPEERLHVIGTVHCTNKIFDSSDRRLKTEVLPLRGVLDKLAGLRPVHFRWNDLARKENPRLDGQKENLGVLAQEVERVFPELVSEGGDYKAVDYGRLNAILLEAVKELKRKNEALRLEIAAWESAKIGVGHGKH